MSPNWLAPVLLGAAMVVGMACGENAFKCQSHIVFWSDRDGQSEIYSMLPDGTGLKRLTTDPSLDDQPTLDPVGAKVAFRSDRSG